MREKGRICHRTGSETNPVVVIRVSGNAVATHEAHGDFRYTDCCLDGDCDAGQACVNGSCQGTCLGIREFCSSTNECCESLVCCFGRCFDPLSCIPD